MQNELFVLFNVLLLRGPKITPDLALLLTAAVYYVRYAVNDLSEGRPKLI